MMIYTQVNSPSLGVVQINIWKLCLSVRRILKCETVLMEAGS